MTQQKQVEKCASYIKKKTDNVIELVKESFVSKKDNCKFKCSVCNNIFEDNYEQMAIRCAQMSYRISVGKSNKSSYGCKVCKEKRKKDVEGSDTSIPFSELFAKRIFDNTDGKVIVDQTTYVNHKTLVKAYCKKHKAIFYKTPNSMRVLKSGGCGECAREIQRDSACKSGHSSGIFREAKLNKGKAFYPRLSPWRKVETNDNGDIISLTCKKCKKQLSRESFYLVGVSINPTCCHCINSANRASRSQIEAYNDNKRKKEEEERIETAKNKIKQSNEKFNNMFDYSLADLTLRANKKVDIKCKKHNILIKISLSNHLKNQSGGCPECEKEARKALLDKKAADREQGIITNFTPLYTADEVKKHINDLFMGQIEIKNIPEEGISGSYLTDLYCKAHDQHIKNANISGIIQGKISGCKQCSKTFAKRSTMLEEKKVWLNHYISVIKRDIFNQEVPLERIVNIITGVSSNELLKQILEDPYIDFKIHTPEECVDLFFKLNYEAIEDYYFDRVNKISW